MTDQEITSPLIASTSMPGSLSLNRRKLIWDLAESIDYYPCNNNIVLDKSRAGRENPLSDSGFRRRKIWLLGISGTTAISLIINVITGIMIGMTARWMELGVDYGIDTRNHALNSYFRSESMTLVAPTMYVLCFAVTLTALSAFFVQFFAPGAAGSGVSLVMAILNGNDLAGLFSIAVYIAKLFGTCASRAALLTLGPEAPMVHLGACVSSLLFGVCRKINTSIILKRPLSKQTSDKYESGDPTAVFTNENHRQIVSAGAAAGLAAAFGAPIGGVLFALEEACSVWSRKIAWRCLICTSTAVFTISQLNPSLRGGGILSFGGIYPLSSRQWLFQMPFVMGVSVLAGLLGAGFNICREKILQFRVARRRHLLRLFEAVAVAIVTAGASFGASLMFGKCLELPPLWNEKHAIRFTCPPGQYNDLATALFASSHYVIKSILALGSESEPINRICTLTMPCYYSAHALLAVVVIYSIGMVLASGLVVPGGLFMPSILSGASLGALFAMILDGMLPSSWDIQPGVYALIGATAMLAAVFRSSISLVVIMVEATSGLEFIVGILAAVIISNFIAHYFHKDGIYESELERDGRVFFLRQEAPGALRHKISGDIMATSIVGLRRIEDVSKIIEILKSSAHNGFPVHPCSSLGAGAPEDPSIALRLDGFVLRSQLLVLLQERAFCDAQGNYLKPPPENVAMEEYENHLEGLMNVAIASSDGVVDASEHGVDPLGPSQDTQTEIGVAHTMLQTIQTLDTLRSLPTLAGVLPEEDGSGDPSTPPFLRRGTDTDGTSIPVIVPRTPRQSSDLYLNLSRFMNRGMLSVRPETPARVVHQMFIGLSLRHLCVTDESSKVLGIITRKDLDHAAGHGWWRANKIAPKPVQDPLRTSTRWFGSYHHFLSAPQQVISNIFHRLGRSVSNDQSSLLSHTSFASQPSPLGDSDDRDAEAARGGIAIAGSSLHHGEGWMKTPFGSTPF